MERLARVREDWRSFVGGQCPEMEKTGFRPDSETFTPPHVMAKMVKSVVSFSGSASDTFNRVVGFLSLNGLQNHVVL